MAVFDENGREVDLESLEHGDVVFSEDGEALVWQEEGREIDWDALGIEPEDDEAELAGVGKSFGSDVLEAISKAVDDDAQKAAIRKAFEVQQEQIEVYKRQAEEAQAWAEREHDTRVTEAFIAKAAEFNLPVAPEVLGPILKKMATVLDESELDIVEKVFTDVGDTLYDEVGYVGTGTNGPDVFNEVEELAKAAVSKAAANGQQISEDDALVAAFEMNPQAYAAYNSEYMGR